LLVNDYVYHVDDRAIRIEHIAIDVGYDIRRTAEIIGDVEALHRGIRVIENRNIDRFGRNIPSCSRTHHGRSTSFNDRDGDEHQIPSIAFVSRRSHDSFPL
jgi:hypothetical protein